MESKTAKIVAGAAAAALLVLELALYLRFRLSRPFFLSTAVIVSAALSAAAAALLHHAAGERRRAARMARRRPSMDDERLRVEYSYFRKVAGLPRKLTLESLAAATDGFQYAVGRGSSGTVYKGILDDGTAVAVKRIDGGADHADKEFKSEVSAIASAQHAHLVRLVGFCLVPRGPRFLVYEYMEHGSLDSRVVTTVRGTTGYLAPEWLLGVGITEKSDVYSYGLVLLEMVGGRRNLMQTEDGDDGSSTPRWTYFPKIAGDMAREGRVMEVLDRRVVESGEAVEEAAVRRLVHVALWCAQEKAGARPTMARVVEMLEGRGAAAEAVEAPPPSDMIVVDLLALDPAARGPGPFGLPPPPAASDGGMQVTSSGISNSFALSYLSGR
uniref:Protein kinase domain-containing protein n=1 Tax=Oryza barthii TaxID=65489 RepID=A0A0D3GCP3_9ORYZ